MDVQDTIRKMREIHHLTQEDMAEKLNISVNGYSKIERGITKLSLEKLEQIANIFNINVSELYSAKEKGFLYFFSEHNGSNYYGNSDSIVFEVEKLKQDLEYKNQIIHELKEKNKLLEDMLELLRASK